MRKIPPLAAVRVFEAAARHGNFTHAASELGMTQAAVSYQMKLLEERLGTKLFLRQKGRLSLSEIGNRIAPLVSGGFDTLEQAFRLASAEDSQTLTISTTQSFAAHWLAPRIGSFQMLAPQLAVRLRSDDHYVDFAAEDVDVVIRVGSGDWPGLRVHFLQDVVIQPFASPDFVAREGGIETPDDLIELSRLSPNEAMEASAAMAGHGIAILNREMWYGEIQLGRLVPVGPSVVAKHGYWLAYPEYHRHSAKIRTFQKWLGSETALHAANLPSAVLG
jgi:LysR family transcriptional regulator, glycine cleavage system transcriptional activator